MTDLDPNEGSAGPVSKRASVFLIVLSLLTAAAEIRLRYQSVPLDRATWLIGDCASYRDVVRSLLEHGSADYSIVNPNEARRYAPGAPDIATPLQSTVSLASDGTLVPIRPILMPLALILPYALLREYGLLLFNVLQCALLILMVYWLSLRFVGASAALLGACGFLAASGIRALMYNVSPDVFGAVLVLGGVLLVWRSPPSAWSLALGGLLLGFSLWLRPSNSIACVAALVPGLDWVRHRVASRGLWVLAGVLTGVSGYLVLNQLWFGNAFVTCYDRILLMEGGVRRVVSLQSFMNRPFLDSIPSTFVADRFSFLGAAPYWPLFLLALPALTRKRAAEALGLSLLVFGSVLALVKYDYWNVSHLGNRLMLLPAAVSAVGIGVTFERILTGRWNVSDREAGVGMTVRGG